MWDMIVSKVGGLSGQLQLGPDEFEVLKMRVDHVEIRHIRSRQIWTAAIDRDARGRRTLGSMSSADGGDAFRIDLADDARAFARQKAMLAGKIEFNP